MDECQEASVSGPPTLDTDSAPPQNCHLSIFLEPQHQLSLLLRPFEMVSIVNLSPEILALCFEQLYNDGPLTTLRQSNLVCRGFHLIVSKLLFRNINITLSRRVNIADNDSTALISFLHRNEELLAHVRSVSILSDAHLSNTLPQGDAHSALEELLPLLPNLQHVRITPIAGSWKTPEHQPFNPSLLAIIENLDVKVALDSYVYTMDPHLLDRFTRLEYLNVILLNKPFLRQRTEPLYTSFDGIPSEEVATMLRKNKELTRLKITLDGSNFYAQHELVTAENAQALGNLVHSLTSLRTLALEGTLNFTDQACFSWSKIWAGLHTLSMCGDALICEAINRFGNSCLALKTLRLDLRSLRLTPVANFRQHIDHVELDSAMESFLPALTLRHLFLAGCQPLVLYSLENSAPMLRSLCWHQTLDTTNLRPPTYTQQCLNTKDLEHLVSTYNRLEWLAIDVEPFQISHGVGNEESTLFIRDRSAAGTLQFGRISTAHSSVQSGANEISQEKGEEEGEEEEPTFRLLTSHRTLRHLRLFIHIPHAPADKVPGWNFPIKDAIHTFLYLQVHKVGFKLESLVILGTQKRGRPNPDVTWIIFEMGKNKIHVSDVTSEQLWDVSDYNNPRPLERRRIRSERGSDWWRYAALKKEFLFPREWLVNS